MCIYMPAMKIVLYFADVLNAMAKISLYYCCCWVLLCLIANDSIGQSFSLTTIYVDSPSLPKPVETVKKFNHSSACQQYVQQLPTLLHAQGFLAASVDSVVYNTNDCKIWVFRGAQYKWHALHVQAADSIVLRQIGYQPPLFNRQILANSYSVEELTNKLLAYFENNGYPFAQISFANVLLCRSSSIEAELKIDKGVYYTLDSVNVVGNVAIQKNFLYQHLQLLPGSAFSKAKLTSVMQKLAELPYLQPTKEWDITMLSNSYVLNVYVQPTKCNQANVLLGLLPSANTTSNKLLLTGDANLVLNNTLGGGELLTLNWQQIQAASPRLVLYGHKPYVFNSSWNAYTGVDIFKKDSSFVNVFLKLGTGYVVNTTQTAKIWLERTASNVLFVDTNAVKITKLLPDIANMRITTVAVAYQLNNVDNVFNPLRGKAWNLSVAFGKKQIRRLDAVLKLNDAAFDYTSLYSNQQLNSYHITIKTSWLRYFPIKKFSVFKTSFQGAWLQSPNYFRNELFQIGGYKLLRGFDEESIYTNRYAVMALEYRYLLAANAFIGAFTDVGVSGNSIVAKTYQYNSGGLLLGLQSKQGILNIAMAVGKRNDAGLNLRTTKLHIGFVSVF